MTPAVRRIKIEEALVAAVERVELEAEDDDGVPVFYRRTIDNGSRADLLKALLSELDARGLEIVAKAEPEASAP